MINKILHFVGLFFDNQRTRREPDGPLKQQCVHNVWTESSAYKPITLATCSYVGVSSSCARFQRCKFQISKRPRPPTRATSPFSPTLLQSSSGKTRRPCRSEMAC